MEKLIFSIIRTSNKGEKIHEPIGSFFTCLNIEYKQPEEDNNLHEMPPRIGCSVALNSPASNCDLCYTYWITTPVVSFKEVDDGWEFTTKNSDYKLKKTIIGEPEDKQNEQ